MAKRIFELAKELGVKSKAIIDKCVAEGIPEDRVKNHMAALSPGLEASIREWFTETADSGGVATAIETAASVDLSKVKAPPRRRAAAKSRAHDGGAPVEHEGDAEPESFPPAFEATDAEPDVEEQETMLPAAEAPPAVAEEPEAAEATAAPSKAVRKTEPEVPAAQAQAPAKAPPQMNVPERPKNVSPAGPQLHTQTPVKLSGPRIVRIEAPEQIERPRPRRDAGSAAARGPGGPGGPGEAGGDDRRGGGARRGASGGAGGGAGGGGGGAGAAARKRPTDATRNVPSRRRGRTDEPITTGMWREQDLLEREARLQRAGGYLKQRRQQLRKVQQATGSRAASLAETGGAVRIAAPFTIRDLSAATGVRAAEIIKKLFIQGVMASINSGIDPAKAQEIMIEYNIELDVTEAKTAEESVHEEFSDRDVVDQRPRSPIITILGHVDHGKTSLLDRIRNAKVAAGEAGGITQATSAFRVTLNVGGETKHVVFLDTPGHEAFTSMRARGANVTDLVVLVVAADDGVMPQTIESINHAKAADVPIVVALNKIDKPEATRENIQRILGQLAEQGLNPIEWGGDTEVVRVSAATGEGVENLLEVLDLQGQILELKGDFGGPGRGTVIESRIEPGRGAVANVIVQDGRLGVGDFIVVGRAYGRVRDILGDKGERLTEVFPGVPVQISGFDELPDAGDKFFIVDSLKKAQEAAEHRRQREREVQLAQPKVTLDTMFAQMADSAIKEIRVVVKADVQGSVDVLRSEIEKVTTDEVRVRVLHAAVGGVLESDILLADASRAIIIGFNVIPVGKARTLAEAKGVEIRTYQVIYEITDDVRKAAEGLLEPEIREEVLGHAEVRKVFKVSRVGAIAGCYVTDGVIERNAQVRVTRDGIVVEHDRLLEQLKRFKDDAKEVRSGNECGMKIAGYDDIKNGDVIECYKKVKIKRTL